MATKVIKHEDEILTVCDQCESSNQVKDFEGKELCASCVRRIESDRSDRKRKAKKLLQWRNLLKQLKSFDPRYRFNGTEIVYRVDEKIFACVHEDTVYGGGGRFAFRSNGRQVLRVRTNNHDVKSNLGKGWKNTTPKNLHNHCVKLTDQLIAKRDAEKKKAQLSQSKAAVVRVDFPEAQEVRHLTYGRGRNYRETSDLKFRLGDYGTMEVSTTYKEKYNIKNTPGEFTADQVRQLNDLALQFKKENEEAAK